MDTQEKKKSGMMEKMLMVWWMFNVCQSVFTEWHACSLQQCLKCCALKKYA